MEITFNNLLAVLPSAITGFGLWAIQNSLKKREVKAEEKEKAREKNEILVIRSVGAAISLGEATACAIRDGKCNGELTAALEYARDVKHEQKDFMLEQSTKNLY